MIPPLSEALAGRGYDTLTPVQEAVTDPEVALDDLLVSAQTGSGKTVGFGLAIAPTLLGEAERFGPAAAPLALVVAPTRELATQVMQELGWLYARTGAQVASCVGGMDIRGERRALERGAHIVVGTPGRLSDHIRRGSLDLSEVRAVVLDEADEMLDLGFREDLEFILGEAPEERRTLLFSATVSPMIARLAEEFQRDAKRINTINRAEQHSDISYRCYSVAPSDTDHAIFNLLRFHDDQGAIVFANTRATVSHLSARLSNRGLPVVTLSGELSQAERSHALQAMRDGRARVCVATDVAARGIDLPNLNLVIHADLPGNTESLLHRSGRTGRAGRKGVSALIVPPRAARRTEQLLKWAKITAEWALPPSADEILRRDEEKLMEAAFWSEPVSEDVAAFAARLLARHGAEAVAAALIRMDRARLAAPEELMPPDAEAGRARRDFGPSRWFALGIGRDAGAEPRRLLPMLRRAGRLERGAIGAIRVQPSETFVEIAEAEAAAFEAALDAAGRLPDGTQVRALDGVPDLVRSPRPAGERDRRRPHSGDAPRRRRTAGDGAPEPDTQAIAARPDAAPADAPTAAGARPALDAAPAAEAPRIPKAPAAPEPTRAADAAPRKKRRDEPAPSGTAKSGPREPGGNRPVTEAPPPAPRAARPPANARDEARPRRKEDREGKATARTGAGKTRPSEPVARKPGKAAGPAGKPGRRKPDTAPSAKKPRDSGAPQKSWLRPGASSQRKEPERPNSGEAAGGKPRAKYQRSRQDAASKPAAGGKGGKSSPGKPRGDGREPPRRGRS